MELSIIVARVLCIIYLTAGVGFILKNIDYHKILDDFIENTGLTYLAGFIAVILGYLLVHYHNLWQANWTVLITIIGWMALIKGCCLIAFPNTLKAFKPVFSEKMLKTLSYCVFMLGLLFGYFGFFT